MSFSSYAYDRRDALRSRLDAVTVKVVRTAGFITSTGAGEGLVDVTFPNTYIEKPAMSFGGELASGQLLTAGSYPTVSIVVATWLTVVKGQATSYIGARLAVVTTGPATQIVIVHWQAEGKATAAPAYVAPINSTGTA